MFRLHFATGVKENDNVGFQTAYKRKTEMNDTKLCIEFSKIPIEIKQNVQI